MITEMKARTWTDEELMALPNDGHKYELVEGELVMSPAGFRHGDISVRLTARLMNVVVPAGLGVVLDSSTGFKMQNGNLLSPDVSFVARERLRGMKSLPEGFFQGAPDLAVEVLSPGASKRHLEHKLNDYFTNGARLAWVIDPGQQNAVVYRGVVPDEVLSLREQLEGDEVVPGFAIAVSDFFEPFPWASE